MVERLVVPLQPEEEESETHPAGLRELMLRVDNRSADMYQRLGVIMGELGAHGQRLSRIEAAIQDLKRARREHREKLASVSDELEDTKTHDLRMMRESRTFWVRFAITTTVLGGLGIAGWVITTLVNHVWR